jgi:apolipoprotein N-acyltransferase
MTADRDRARRFRLALARGYAEHCRRTARPTRIERLAAWLGMGLLVPCVSSPWWSEDFREGFGPILGWALMVMLLLLLISAAVGFIMSIWQQRRDLLSFDETWRR